MDHGNLLILTVFVLGAIAAALVIAAGRHPRLRRPGWAVWCVAMALLAIGFAIY